MNSIGMRRWIEYPVTVEEKIHAPRADGVS